MKHMRTPLILLTLILVLIGVSYWEEQESKKDANKVAESSKLSDFLEKNAVAITYEKKDEKAGSSIKVAIEKNGGTWHIVSPIVSEADSEMIGRWLKTLEEAKFEKSFAVDSRDLGKYGLDSPEIQIHLRTSDSKEYEFHLGNKSPIGFSSYLQTSRRDQVYLVSQYIVTASSKKLDDFRNRRLGLPVFSEVNTLEIKNNHESLAFSMNSDDWQSSDLGDGAVLDKSELEAFYSELMRHGVESFLDKPSEVLTKALSLNNPGTKLVGKVVVGKADHTSKEWLFFENNSVVYGKIPGVDGFVTLDKKLQEAFNFDKNKFVDRTFFHFTSGDIEKVSVDSQDFIKKNDEWFGKNDNKKSIQLKLLLVDLEFAKAEEIQSVSHVQGLGADQRKHVLSFEDKNGKLFTYEFFDKAGDNTKILVKATDKVGVFQKEALEKLDAFYKIEAKGQISSRDK